MKAKNTGEGLKRVIGVPGLAATIVNNTMGAGIYVLPAIVSIRMGAAGILGYLFCGAILVTIMLCYMEIGSKVTTSGGSYVYVETAFGPFAGFIINWLFFFGYGILSSAAVINLLADSLAVIFPVFSETVMRVLLFLVLLGGLAWVNMRGAKGSVKVLEYITLIKLVPLLGIIILAFTHIKTANLHWEHWPPSKNFGATVLLLFFAFAGFETSLSVSGEIKDPKRTIPRGVLFGGLMVFVIYLLLQTITQGVLGGQMGEFKNAPLAAVAQSIVGPVGATVLIIGAIVSCLGNTGGDIMATPRLLFAGARDGLFPAFLAKVHPKFATPYWSVIIYAGLIFIFASTGGFQNLAEMSSCFLLLIYLAVVLSTLKLRAKKHATTEKVFKTPGGLLVPFIAIAAIIYLLVLLPYDKIWYAVGFIAAICLVYFIMKWFKTKTGAPIEKTGS